LITAINIIAVLTTSQERMETDEYFTIKVKTMDSHFVEIKVTKQTLVSDLKVMISQARLY
jgi:hypothetical protein